MRLRNCSAIGCFGGFEGGEIHRSWLKSGFVLRASFRFEHSRIWKSNELQTPNIDRLFFDSVLDAGRLLSNATDVLARVRRPLLLFGASHID